MNLSFQVPTAKRKKKKNKYILKYLTFVSFFFPFLSSYKWSDLCFLHQDEVCVIRMDMEIAWKMFWLLFFLLISFGIFVLNFYITEWNNSGFIFGFFFHRSFLILIRKRLAFYYKLITNGMLPINLNFM